MRLPTRGRAVPVALLLAAAAAVADPSGMASAQTSSASGAGSRGLPLTVGVSAGYYSLGGSDFPGVGLGPGLELTGHYALTPSVQVGLGAHGSWQGADELSSPLRLLGGFVEQRTELDEISPGVRPFFGFRLGYVGWRAVEKEGGVDATVRADGLQAGAQAGVSYPLTPSVTADVALYGSFLSFGDSRVDAAVEGTGPLPPSTFPRSETRGSLFGIRIGARAAVP